MRLVRATLIATIIAILSGSLQMAFAQTSQSQPATPAASTETDPKRIADLAAIIDGPNASSARETGARELLRDGSPEALQRLIGLLNGSNSAAKIAIANVIAANGDSIDTALLDALIPTLASPEPEVATAAAAALSVGGEAASERLGAYVQADANPMNARSMAIRALGLTPDYAAVRALVGILDSPKPELARAACDALELAAGQRFQGDIAAARNWWVVNGSESRTKWQSQQLRRMAADRRKFESNQQLLEQRLAKTLRECYQRTPDAERAALIQAYLSDSIVVAQRVGLEIAQSEATDSRPLKPETIGAVRRLLASDDAQVRETATQTLTAIRDPADADRLLERLGVERAETVRRALLNGLGYLGADNAADALLKQIGELNGSLIGEAVTALGRMIERGALNDESLARIAEMLQNRYHATPRENSTLRERVLWAMSRLRRPTFVPIYVEVLSGQDSAVVRQAAVRGIAGLESPPPEAIDALQRAIADPDASVRKAAVETFGGMQLTDAQLEKLWARLATAQEPDEAVREAAWRAALRLLSSRPPAEIEAWVARLPAGDPNTPRRSVDLLMAAIGNAPEDAAHRDEIGRLRKRVAQLRESTGQIDKAIEIYAQALADFRAANSPALAETACDFLRLLLINRRYEAASTQSFAGAATPKDLFAVVTREAEARLTDNPVEVDLAINILDAYREHPAASPTPEIDDAMNALVARAEAHRATLDAKRVERAITALRSNANDAAARETISTLGRRAATPLCAELDKVLAAQPANEAEEQLLVDLLKSVLPDWPGFPPGADTATKKQSLETARRSGQAKGPDTARRQFSTRFRA